MTRYLFFLFFVCAALPSAAQNAVALYAGLPVFHGAKVASAYPATDFLFTVPATGERPISFSAAGLPAGLQLDKNTGIIRGKVAQAGTYPVKITAVNKQGSSEQILKIVIGETLCLTPPMGWNSWNVFTNSLDEKLVMETADAMVRSGMRDVGYQYINMDDFWHALSRDASGKPVADSVKFPHGIPWLADYAHERGLKLGIYSDAGAKTCGKCFGSYGAEEIDAATYAEWGIDLLKYDFCYVPWSKKQAVARYKKMGDALRSSGRSIVYSVCNWGLFQPWKWAADLGGNYWRIAPDIVDSWRVHPPWFSSVMSSVRRQSRLAAYARPGHWNDPDMMIVGNYGKGKATGGKGKYKGLNDTEYRAQMSLWAMLAAPLLASCDLRNMNESTKEILLNPDLLALNQDGLGRQAELVCRRKGIWVFKKPLENGDVAVALLNSRKHKAVGSLTREQLGLSGNYQLYNVWTHTLDGTLSAATPYSLQPHEALVLRLKATP